jgi:hypothetical protein
VSQGDGGVSGDHVVRAEHPAATRQGVLAKGAGRLPLAQLVESEQQGARGGEEIGVVPDRGGGEHVRNELGVGGPAGRVLLIAGGSGGRQRHYPLGGGPLPVGGQLVADDGLHEPVDLEGVGVAAGQGVAD